MEYTPGAKMALYLLLKILTSDWSANAINMGKIIKLISSMLTLNLNTQDTHSEAGEAEEAGEAGEAVEEGKARVEKAHLQDPGLGVGGEMVIRGIRGTKYFSVFDKMKKSSPKRLETEEEKPIEKHAPKSLKIMCEEMLPEIEMPETTREKISLQQICRENLRELLCRAVDTPETKESLKRDCHECGRGIWDEDKESYIIGSDVVALFPSIKSRSTGMIVRKRVEKTTLKFPGFNYRHGLRYIRMNRNLTGDLSALRFLLPRRRKKQGVTPSMTGKAGSDRQEEDDGECQWFYPDREPTELHKRMIIARCCEIAVRTVFENFTYKFGGKFYKQQEGGPIGARLTMCAARLVMM